MNTTRLQTKFEKIGARAAVRPLVRGTISHPAHTTICLHGWHQVAMNSENQSRAMAQVAFLD